MPDLFARPARLRAVAAMCDAEPFLLGLGQTMSVEFGRDTTELHLHGCTPEELTRAYATWPHAASHVDGDDIMRWIEVTLHGIGVTLYRR